MRYKKLITYVQSHASAVSLLESKEQRYIKAINNNNQTVARKHGFNIMQEEEQEGDDIKCKFASWKPLQAVRCLK